MRNHKTLLCAVGLSLLLGCGEAQQSQDGANGSSAEPVELVQPAPPEVADALVELLKSAEGMLPGAAVSAFESFLTVHHGYETDRLARNEIDHYRDLASKSHGKARELARAGDFERAEVMFVDLATHLPDTDAGHRAAEHLSYDFYANQAQHYLVRRRFADAERIARTLLSKDLTPDQAEPLEQILDNLGHVNAAMGQAERASAMSACRQLMVMLATRYVEEGSYPTSLSMSSLDDWDPMSSRAVRRSISKIEGYRASDNLYSFVAVSSSGQHRIEVIDCEIQDPHSR